MGERAWLAEEQRRTLARLSQVAGVGDLYLAGGTAVAFHLRHRQSVDLDLFTRHADVDLEVVRAKLVAALPDIVVLAQTDVALSVRIDATPVDIVAYGYPLLDEPTIAEDGTAVAGRRDLAAMKLSAIARRGLRRDFWDLYALTQSSLSFADTAAAYLARFGKAEADLYHVMRALTYFDDAEREPVLPRGMTPELWDQIKAYFRREAPALLSQAT